MHNTPMCFTVASPGSHIKGITFSQHVRQRTNTVISVHTHPKRNPHLEFE